MARIRRLRRRPDFLAAAGGRRFHTERVTAQGRPRAPDETRDGAPAEGLHVGFTITKRVGHATERNRIRRRLRAALAVLARETAQRGLDAAADVVLIARRPALSAPFDTLLDDLRRALGTVTRPRAAKAATQGSGRGSGQGAGQAAGVPRRDAPAPAASGAPERTGAHVRRRAGRGQRSGKGSGKGSGQGSSGSPGQGSGTETAHETTDG